VDEASTRYALPFILPGQAQKELLHNEAIAKIDAALHPSVKGAPLSTPPGQPSPGDCWLIGLGANGAWAGKDNHLAAWTSGGWRFVSPMPGMSVWDETAHYHRRWTGTAWTSGEIAAGSIRIGGVQVVGPRLPSVATASGGTIIDAEARAAIASLIVTLRTHGLIE
jgi:hypothetical protein